MDLLAWLVASGLMGSYLLARVVLGGVVSLAPFLGLERERRRGGLKFLWAEKLTTQRATMEPFYIFGGLRL